MCMYITLKLYSFEPNRPLLLAAALLNRSLDQTNGLFVRSSCASFWTASPKTSTDETVAGTAVTATTKGQKEHLTSKTR